ncbi:MAG: F0F1 ATP synthase subunit A [Syntrophomonadaceae bacterium]|nr:F0F1 ATP synthase subunit A [Syntrophomonadaceae bacterium]
MMFGMWDSTYFHIGPIPVDHLVVTQWAIVLVVALIAFFATRNMQTVPRGLQNVFEWALEWCHDFFTQLMDNKDVAKRFAPLLTCFFIFILFSNYSGLIPGAAVVAGFQPPTSNWNVTIIMACITVFAVHISGFQQKGFHHLGHFLSPTPMMLPLNILEEITHPLSLTVRLFGNVFGEEMVVAFLLYMVPFVIPAAIMGLGVLLGAIQAIVFTILSANYIATATNEGH